MSTFMQTRGYGTQSGNSLNNFHSVFGGSAGDTTGTPPLLDLSEFPSLTNARGNDSLPQTNALQPPGSKPYGKYKCICKQIVAVFIENSPLFSGNGETANGRTI